MATVRSPFRFGLGPKVWIIVVVVTLVLAAGGLTMRFATVAGLEQMPAATSELDRRVLAFLERRRGTWRDMNVPQVDGRTLYDLIVKHGYTRALEISTSTGYSGIWIAWGLSKTGGRLLTIDIDERRHRIARDNFEQAGLSAYIDAKLGDAHELVPRLEGPFDFVFSGPRQG